MPSSRSARILAVLLLSAVVPGSSADDPPAPNDADLVAAKGWFDGLGFPDLGRLPFVRVYCGQWSQSGDAAPVARPIHGFLLGDEGPRFTVITAECFTTTFEKREPESSPWERVAYEPVDLIAAVKDALHRDAAADASPAAQFRSGRSPWDAANPYGLDSAWTGEFHRTFVIARACEARGRADLALRLWNRIVHVEPPGIEFPPWSLGDVVREHLGTATFRLLGQAFGEKGRTHASLLADFRRALLRFPTCEPAPWARGVVRVLERMVEDERRRAAVPPKPFEEMTEAERMEELTFRLRETGPGDRLPHLSPSSAYVRLAAGSLAAVPALIRALDDDAFTHWVWPHVWCWDLRLPNTYFVRRVGDVALEIIERDIAHRRFFESTRPGEAWIESMVEAGAAPAVRARVEAWWNEARLSK